MPITVYRIDERLLHGQVVVGWGRRLGIGFYAVVDDGIAGTAWERDLYGSALPTGVESFFFTVEDGIERLPELEGRGDVGMVLTAGTAEMRRLGEAGLLVDQEVNLGGLHAKEGRERLLDYLFASRDELQDIRVLGDLAGTVSARDLPGSPRIGLRRLLKTVERARP
jgi:PTS system mannose-specific IIB component/fructoselysine and glucoselysine-specific PTS system IIB component